MKLDGDKVKIVMAETGLRQRDIVKATGFCRETVWKASNSLAVGEKAARAIADCLGVPIDDIVLEWSKVKKPIKCDKDCFNCKFDDCIL